MELRQLRYFIKVAERLSVSEAAKDLCITQSTLSQQIRQLENELGVQLFDRTSRGVKLTEMGVEMLPYAATYKTSKQVCSAWECHTVSDQCWPQCLQSL